MPSRKSTPLTKTLNVLTTTLFTSLSFNISKLPPGLAGNDKVEKSYNRCITKEEFSTGGLMEINECKYIKAGFRDWSHPKRRKDRGRPNKLGSVLYRPIKWFSKNFSVVVTLPSKCGYTNKIIFIILEPCKTLDVETSCLLWGVYVRTRPVHYILTALTWNEEITLQSRNQ